MGFPKAKTTDEQLVVASIAGDHDAYALAQFECIKAFRVRMQIPNDSSSGADPFAGDDPFAQPVR